MTWSAGRSRRPRDDGSFRDHLETAGAAWLAYRASTPQAWFDLLPANLNLLPRLRWTVAQLWRWDPDNWTLVAP